MAKKKAKKSSRYKYTALESNQFRLLRFVSGKGKRLRCTLKTYRLDECPQFCALSYTWGPAQFPDYQQEQDLRLERTRSILCDDGRLGITENLFDACSQLQKPGLCGFDQFVWIDAICINQKSAVEKSQQILHMSEIYNRARKVIVWLGHPCVDFEDFMWTTTFFHDKLKACLKRSKGQDILFKSLSSSEVHFELDCTSERLDKRLRGFQRFCENRRWYSRIWTIQETAISETKFLYPSSSSPEITMLCGVAEIPFFNVMVLGFYMELGYWWRDITSTDSARQGRNPSLLGRVEIYKALSNFEHGVLRESFRSKAEFIFGAKSNTEVAISYIIIILLYTTTFQSTDERDRLFAVIVLLQPHLPDEVKAHLKPDYSLSAEDVFVNFAKFVVTSLPRLSLLSLVRNPSGRKLQHLPSWVPDYSLTAPFCESLVRPKIPVFDAMCSSRCKPGPRRLEGSILVCDGAEFDYVVNTCTAENDEFHTGAGIIELLKFCYNLAEEVNGVDRIEACWRTLLGNVSISENMQASIEYPAHQSSEINFKYWIAILICYYFEHPESNLSLSDCGAWLRRLDPAGTSKALPSIEEVIELRKAMEVKRGEEGLLDAQKLYEMCYDEAARYTCRTLILSCERRLIITQKGFLGMTAKHVVSGDRVVFLHDSLVPFVLRKRGDGDSMELIGDCYLHGFMNGEVLEEKWGLKERIRPIRIS